MRVTRDHIEGALPWADAPRPEPSRQLRHKPDCATLHGEPAPCDACPLAALCGSRLLACAVFEGYCATGKVGKRRRVPTPETYNRLFPNG